MAKFMLIDLASQSEAVQKLVKGWRVETILSWMKQFGTVEQKKDNFGNTIYRFCSFTGQTDVFFFDKDDKLNVIVTGWKMYP